MGEKERKEAKGDAEGYLATIESLEPDIYPIDASAFYASAAISLKRIADATEELVQRGRPPVNLSYCIVCDQEVSTGKVLECRNAECRMKRRFADWPKGSR